MTPERRRRISAVTWSSVWLVVLVGPAHATLTGKSRPVWLAGAMLVSFVAVYLTLLWLSSDPGGRLLTRLILLAPLTAIAVGGSLAFHGDWAFLLFFLSAAFASALPERSALVGVAAVTALSALLLTQPAAAPAGRAEIFGVFMAGVFVLYIRRMVRLITELNSARHELAQLAVADERLRFARDLHDLLGHTLSLIVVKSEAVRRLIHHDAEAAARESRDIEQVGRQALAEVREAVTGYRERSLEAELEGARAALLAAGIEAVIHTPREPLPDAVGVVLGWTVREGVTNVVRHSRGRHCDIHVRHANGEAVLEIRDDGPGDGYGAGTAGFDAVGFDAGGFDAGGFGAGAGGGGMAARPGSGLRGLAERLAAARGRLEAGRHPDGGFRLAVMVPLDQPQGAG